ncbi:cytochrome P450 4c3-like isoform X3 [Tribolium madens]|uniref:cytochrome P450 4c3-like isoform X3 n=1 Tax=Tribolium madens TaxID=41895 RepID=UPI001CF72908|nr:cytochrome P450 4c3-like isoform X3 [Tribolium madens]
MVLVAEYLIALALIIFPLYYYFTKFSALEKFYHQFPSPPKTPFFGNALELKTTRDLFQSFHKYAKTYGTMVHLKIGPFQHMLLCSNPKFLEFLLTSNTLLKKSPNLRHLQPWIGTGVATAYGPKWKLHRKLVTPAFHYSILGEFVKTFESSGNILIGKLSKIMVKKDDFDLYPHITRCTFDIICETAMGTKANVQITETSDYFESIKEMCRIFMSRTMAVFHRYDFIFRFSRDFYLQKKALETIHNYSRQVIASKRENGTENDDLGRKKKIVFLDLILNKVVDGHTFTPEAIRGEVDTFMFAGHDTTATAISFILFCIANHNEVQDQIIEEQKRLFGQEQNPNVTFTNLQEMEFLECVIKEGLRLYTPVPLYGRQIDQNVEFDGLFIPKGVNVVIFTHGIHMNPDFYPNPEKFDPSRFEKGGDKHPFQFMPFSAGPRICEKSLPCWR